MLHIKCNCTSLARVQFGRSPKQRRCLNFFSPKPQVYGDQHAIPHTQALHETNTEVGDGGPDLVVGGVMEPRLLHLTLLRRRRCGCRHIERRSSRRDLLLGNDRGRDHGLRWWSWPRWRRRGGGDISGCGQLRHLSLPGREMVLTRG
jgi:hypothetical protein